MRWGQRLLACATDQFLCDDNFIHFSSSRAAHWLSKLGAHNRAQMSTWLIVIQRLKRTVHPESNFSNIPSTICLKNQTNTFKSTFQRTNIHSYGHLRALASLSVVKNTQSDSRQYWFKHCLDNTPDSCPRTGCFQQEIFYKPWEEGAGQSRLHSDILGLGLTKWYFICSIICWRVHRFETSKRFELVCLLVEPVSILPFVTITRYCT